MKNITRCFATLILCSGCAFGGNGKSFQSGFDGGVTPSFWTQKVSVEAYGFTMMTMYGPFTLGYLKWQRNLDNPTSTIPTIPVPPIGMKEALPSNAITQKDLGVIGKTSKEKIGEQPSQPRASIP